MTIEIGLTEQVSNTQYAPLAVLGAHYQENKMLEQLQSMQTGQKKRDFQVTDKLTQVLTSILIGCNTLSEVNSKLRSEARLAQVWGWPRIADQSTLSRTLDLLSLKQIEELRSAITGIWQTIGQTKQHDWRRYLWLDYDLSSLPCGKQAEASHKGFIGDKKTSPADN
jgi:hypothetical protein